MSALQLLRWHRALALFLLPEFSQLFPTINIRSTERIFIELPHEPPSKRIFQNVSHCAPGFLVIAKDVIEIAFLPQGFTGTLPVLVSRMLLPVRHETLKICLLIS